ncbi:16S rRNA (guanine(966)-N(2))-methyltransferase [hydrothermal vent metagenome]|uniref:16S rRNA (Guanine(966)-N(2))-methyltransferase n=1 Tax=hydrothermal vent metagenome TaxID=652676 RepID=A0A3B0ZX82_9ZZZZ
MAHNSKAGQLRIIGGSWRGRKIDFVTEPGVRPTPDRIRETLFNWLQTSIAGARCLDLFSGSGALGFEALSRGANEVIMVEQSSAVTQQLRANATLLKTGGAQIEQCNADNYLKRPAQPFDIIFLDPPFETNSLENYCSQLASNGWLAPHAQIYMERAKGSPAPQLPADWQMHREKQSGKVCYALATRSN